MSDSFEEMKAIYEKINQVGAGFFVARRKDGSVDWSRFERAPIDGWFYVSAAGEWVAEDDGDAENNLAVSGEDIAGAHDLGARLTRDEQRRLVSNWEEAAQQHDREHGIEGFVSSPMA